MVENEALTGLLNNRIALAIVAALLGIIGTIVAQRWLNRRSLFTYSVFHSQIGLSAEDAIYGSVQITWNGNLVNRLYLSTIDLTNQSAKDFESVMVRAFTNNTVLLTQKTMVVGTTRVIEFTDEYKRQIAVGEESLPTEYQVDLHSHNRDYIVPTMNRGQTIRFEFLNAAESDEEPQIWLDVLHEGVNCKFRPWQDQFKGVPQPTAVLEAVSKMPDRRFGGRRSWAKAMTFLFLRPLLVGNLVCASIVLLMLFYVEDSPIPIILSYILGVFVLLPGTYAIKFYRQIRNWFAG